MTPGPLGVIGLVVYLRLSTKYYLHVRREPVNIILHYAIEVGPARCRWPYFVCLTVEFPSLGVHYVLPAGGQGVVRDADARFGRGFRAHLGVVEGAHAADGAGSPV